MSASVKSIYIEDFQSHAKTKIELPGPGRLCVIVGPTDSGKTAIVRALRLLLYNQPQGSDYIRVGRDKATVAIEMEDGTKVARERSRGSINRYRVAKPGETGVVLEGFGASVPVEVQEITGVRVVSIGETLDLALNLSEQLDGPFLGKSVSGPAKAKILGALAGTEEVDEAHKALGTDVYRAGQDEKRLIAEIQSLDTKIAEYDYLPALKESIAALESLVEDAKSAQERLGALSNASAQLSNINDRRAQAIGVLARWAGLSEASLHAEAAQERLAKMQTLQGHKASLERIRGEHSKWFPIVYVKWAELDAVIEVYEALEQAWSRKNALTELRKELQATAEGIAKSKTTLSRWKGLADAEASYIDAYEGATRLQALVELSSRLACVSDAQTEAGKQHSRWYRLDDAAQVASEIPTMAERLSALIQASSALMETRQARIAAENALAKHSKALADAQSLYVDTLILLGTCPICGSEMDPKFLGSHIKEVI